MEKIAVLAYVSLYASISSLIVAAALYFPIGQSADVPEKIDTSRGPVMVTQSGPHDGGEYGCETPKSQTCGIQEAINAAVEQERDVYISGGAATGLGKAVSYNITKTIEIPPLQDFSIDGGEYVIKYVPQDGGTVIRVNSCMDCHFKFGLIVASLNDNGILFKPEDPTPIDNIIVITDSTFETASVAGRETGIFPGAQKKLSVGGVILDASHGSIVFNKFTFPAVVGFHEGVSLVAPDLYWISSNTIVVQHLHEYSIGWIEKDTQIGSNTVHLVHSSEPPGNYEVGTEIRGISGLYTITIPDGGAKVDLRIASEATNNLITISNTSPLKLQDLSEGRNALTLTNP